MMCSYPVLSVKTNKNGFDLFVCFVNNLYNILFTLLCVNVRTLKVVLPLNLFVCMRVCLYIAVVFCVCVRYKIPCGWENVNSS